MTVAEAEKVSTLPETCRGPTIVPAMDRLVQQHHPGVEFLAKYPHYPLARSPFSPFPLKMTHYHMQDVPRELEEPNS